MSLHVQLLQRIVSLQARLLGVREGQLEQGRQANSSSLGPCIGELHCLTLGGHANNLTLATSGWMLWP